MHILYLHQHFAMPSGSTGTRSYELARRWVKAGHQITLICGKSDQSGLPECNNLFHELETDGIHLVIINTRYSNKHSFFRRVMSFFSFILFSFWAGLRVGKVDVIYATSTPLTIGIPAMLLKWFKHVPFIFEVRDQWPQIPIEMGIIKNPLLKRVLCGLEKHIYKSSAGIVALSPGMAEGVHQILAGVDREVVIASNSSDTELFRPDIDGSQIRLNQDWQDRFVVLHFGAMGRANGLDFLVDVARRMCDTPQMHFVIIGEGSEKNRLRGKIKELGLENIEILDTFSKNQMPQVVAACDISTVIFADYLILEHNSANKFFDSLSAGKPILLNYSGWQREKIEEYKCGYGCELFNVDEYIEKLMHLYKNRDQLPQMGCNARKLAEKEFNRDLISNRILTLIEKIQSLK